VQAMCHSAGQQMDAFVSFIESDSNLLSTCLKTKLIF
jgi:hypothetical protein